VVLSIKTEEQLITQRKKSNKSDRANESNLVLENLKVAVSINTCTTFDEYCPIPCYQNRGIPNLKGTHLKLTLPYLDNVTASRSELRVDKCP